MASPAQAARGNRTNSSPPMGRRQVGAACACACAAGGTEHSPSPRCPWCTGGYVPARRRNYTVAIFCITASLLYADQNLMAPNLTAIAQGAQGGPAAGRRLAAT